MANLSVKHRAKLLEDVYGHDKVIHELVKRQKENNFPKVIYMTGAPGIGKTTLMKIIAKSILCGNKDVEGNPCNKCKVCSGIDQELPSNYYFEKNASNLKIEDMREIDTSSKKKPLGEVSHKVFVIDELQELARNPAAQKNILKTLENPSGTSYFILGSMDDSKVNAAIKRRAVTYKLKDIEAGEIANYLMSICIAEKIEIDEKKENILFKIAEGSNGSPGIAVPLLERVIYSELWDLTLDELTEELDIVDNDLVTNLLAGLINGDVEVFTKTYTDKVLDTLRFQLNLIFKAKNDILLSSWQKQQIDKTGFSKVGVETIKRVIDELNKLYLYPFVTPTMIESSLISIFSIFKLEVAQPIVETKPLPRRKPL